ncbi:MAG: DedA family protein [bacterium]|nr:DedA family protein [bacterium]
MIFSFAQIFSWLISYKYLILFPITVVEGPIITIIAGFLSSLGIFNLLIAYLVVLAGDLAGDSLYYAIGRWGREKFIAKWGKYIGLNIGRVVRMEEQFKKRGQSILIWGKISHVFGSIILVSAGIVKVKYRDFLFFNFLATLPKSAIFILIGFYFGQAYARIYKYFDWTVLIMFSLGIASIIVYLIIKKYADKTYQID